MKHVKLFEEFSKSVNEYLDEPSLQLLKSLHLLGKDFKSDEEIVKAIEDHGFKRIEKTRTTATDYWFDDPKSGSKYVSYKSGTVRNISKGSGRFTKNNMIITPITRSKLETPRLRLLLILRRAMKSDGSYKDWQEKNKMSMSDFKYKSSYRGTYLGKNYGV